MERLFVDTSAWFAYVNKGDPEHAATRNALREFEGRLLTSNLVFAEVVTLCLFRLGHRTASKVGSVLLDPDVTDLVRITAGDEDGAWRLFQDRSDQLYSFTDCTSFHVMRRLGITKAASLDDDFLREGFQVLPSA